MAVQEKAKLLESLLAKQIEGFSSKRKNNKAKALFFRLVVFSCSALTTILIGLNSVNEAAKPIIKDVALFFSALLTGITALEAFLNHKALWIRYTATANQLKTLQSRLAYLTSGGMEGVNEADIDRLFSEFEKLLADSNAEWLQLRKDTEKGSGT
jgi:hypothetical protein